MRRSRVGMLMSAGLALCASACGSTGTVDHLSGKSAAELVKSAQTWLRTGHYHFHGSASQTSYATDLSGVPDSFAQYANSSISLTADGDVDGSKHITEQAVVDGHATPIRLVEVGCNGYASTDGQSWYEGNEARWLTRMVAPGFDDGLTALHWHDLGPTTRNGVAVHHIQATMDVMGFGGAAPSPGATPPPGITMQPTPVDLWLRSDDGSVVEMTQTADATTDLHAIAPSAPQEFRNAAGTTQQHMQATYTFSQRRQTVSAPAATLSQDPVPNTVYTGFGLFGTEADDCPGV